MNLPQRRLGLIKHPEGVLDLVKEQQDRVHDLRFQHSLALEELEDGLTVHFEVQTDFVCDFIYRVVRLSETGGLTFQIRESLSVFDKILQ